MGALPKALRRRGIDAGSSCRFTPASRGTSSSASTARSRCGPASAEARGAVRMSTLPKSEVPIYFLEHHHYFDRPYLYGPPITAIPTTSSASRTCRAARSSSAGRSASFPTFVHAQRLADRASFPVYLNTVEWSKPLARQRQRLFDFNNLAYQGVWDEGRSSSRGSDTSTTTLASSSTSGR